MNGNMARHLVLFAREPRREARVKGFSRSAGGELFAALAQGWTAAARQSGAQLAVATPPEDRAAWNRWFVSSEKPLWLDQQGASFGERLEGAGRSAADLGGHAVLVGGDVVPSPEALDAAFRLLEDGADAVLGPARDGGFSLVGLRREDLDLLRHVAPRRSDAFDRLCRGLLARGRKISRVPGAPDLDRRKDARVLLRGDRITREIRMAVRREVAIRADFAAAPEDFTRPVLAAYGTGLRAPPPSSASI
jgi:glycosyltransferase A (GT-A) superfamily protein (DUF2064 family)